MATQECLGESWHLRKLHYLDTLPATAHQTQTLQSKISQLCVRMTRVRLGESSMSLTHHTASVDPGFQSRCRTMSLHLIVYSSGSQPVSLNPAEGHVISDSLNIPLWFPTVAKSQL